MGSLFEHLATAADTAGTLGVSVVTQPPGIATPLHVHSKEAEALFVLDGEITYQIGQDRHELAPGSFVYLPAGLPHAFRIGGTTPARFLSLCAPGGLMDLYDEVGTPATQRRLPGVDGLSTAQEIERWNQVAPRYGLSVVGPPIPPG